MKKLELKREVKLKHLKYCIGKKKNKAFMKSRPYGRLIIYQDSNYPESINIRTKTIKINISKNARREMVKYLLENFNSIIIGNPKKLIILEKEFYNLIHSLELKNKKTVTISDIKERLNKFLSWIFNYESFSSSDPGGKWGPYQLIESLNNSVCAYCNAQFTHIVYRPKNSVEGQVKIRPSLDHFLPRSIHPLLGVSIYNLIPACYTCNSSLKGDKDISLDQIIHPFLDSLDEIGYFEREFNVPLPETYTDYSDFYSQVVGRSTNYDIKLKSHNESASEKLVGFKRLFEIEERYAQHKRIINDFVKKNIIYTDIYLNELKGSYCYLFENTYSLKEIIIEEDINNNILSKIVKDITLNELKLVK
ncbi:hypothetical protein OOZ25_14285 [Bacillus subtilis]|uniref:hypothetical protein n=1 Tax=Bacillus subtilis TaxID=1423 RepID=UPI002552EE1F|nr:hypothetical protein [Bacillus subtilis]MDL2030474.1 hypothetical protein [Bacillus subtilis]